MCFQNFIKDKGPNDAAESECSVLHKTPKRRKKDTNEELLGLLKSNNERLEESQDCDKNFLLSLLDWHRKLTEEQKFEIRIDITNLYKKYLNKK